MPKKLARKYEEALMEVKESQARMAEMKMRIKAIEQEYVPDVMRYKNNMAILVEFAKKRKLPCLIGAEGKLEFTISAVNDISTEKLYNFVMKETGSIEDFFSLIKPKTGDTIKKYTEPLLMAEGVLKKKVDKYSKPKVI